MRGKVVFFFNDITTMMNHCSCYSAYCYYLSSLLFFFNAFPCYDSSLSSLSLL